MKSTFLPRLLASLALATFASADYHIDDQNYTALVYSETPGGAKWVPFQEGGEALSLFLPNSTLMTVDPSQCFNYTFTYAPCTIANDCQLQIPFSGSGITIYVLQAGAQGVNASLTIDSGVPVYNNLPAPLPPNFYIPNIALFSVHGITTGDHTATMTIQSWDDIFSGMLFDYAAINQTVVSPATTTSLASPTTVSKTSIPTKTQTSTSSSSTSNSHVGAIVGGVVGVLLILVTIPLAIFYVRRRGHCSDGRGSSVNLDAEPKLEPFIPEEQQHYPGPERHSIPPPVTTQRPVTSHVSAQQTPQSTTTLPHREKSSRLSVTNPSSSVTSRSRLESFGANSPDTSESSRPRIQQEYPTLSDDQADFVNSLYANNVPATAIARVIERMMAGERRPVVNGYNAHPPPSYQHVSGDV